MVLYPSNFCPKLKLAIANIEVILGSQDINNQHILFYTIYTNYNHKLQKRVRKPKIPWDKFKRLAFNGSSKICQEEKGRQNDVMIYIYFGRGKHVLLLILTLTIKSKIYLWRWDRIFIDNKCSDKQELDKCKTKIVSRR